ncbi:MAG: hypothetical protein ACRDN0_16210 [Trebonia sp.]
MTVTAARITGAAARRARPVPVPAALADLRGPDGVLELPPRLYWSGGSAGGRFDLTDPDQAALAYESVLETARGLGDITAHLNAGLLAALWPAIALGMRTATRRAWETSFPGLAAPAAAAPAAA